MTDFTNFAKFMGLTLSTQEDTHYFTLLKEDGETLYKTCRITKEGLWFLKESDLWQPVPQNLYLKMIEGTVTVKKVTFHPKENETYYYVYNNEAMETTWENDMIDYENYFLGNCFATEEEALMEGVKLFLDLKEFYENEGHNLNATVTE